MVCPPFGDVECRGCVQYPAFAQHPVFAPSFSEATVGSLCILFFIICPSCACIVPQAVAAAAAAAKSLQSCPALCDPIDGGPPGYPVPGILQARTLEWVAIAFSNA